MSRKVRLDTNLFGVVSAHIKEFPLYYVGALICLVVTHYVQSYLPFMARDIADAISEERPFQKTYLFFIIAISIIIFRTLSRLLFFYPARMMQKFLRVELLYDLENTPPNRYESFSAGQIFQIIGNDIDQIRALCGFALLQFGNIVIALAVLLPQLARFEIRLVWALAPLLAGFIMFSIIVISTRKYWRLTQDYQGEVQNLLIETYNGKTTIKNFHVENKFINLFNEYCAKELSSFYKSGIGVAFSMPFIPLGIGFSLIWGAQIIFAENLGANALILFSGFIFLFLEPMMFVSWIGIVLTSALSSWSRIVELRNALKMPSSLEKSQLNFEHLGLNLNLEYWRGEINLSLKKNSVNVLVGDTGCGKTYLLNQVALHLKLAQKNISYVSQHPYLYNDTIKDNIFLGNETTKEDLELAKKLLNIFGLDYLAKNSEDLLALKVGENGKKISGGQAKRVALIKSLMQKSDYLLWDDPFSSVDVLLEKEIFDKLKEQDLLNNKTIIMTSHRLTTVRNSHYVYYLGKKEGMIEHGDVLDVLQKDKRIYEFFKSQMV